MNVRTDEHVAQFRRALRHDFARRKLPSIHDTPRTFASQCQSSVAGLRRACVTGPWCGGWFRFTWCLAPFASAAFGLAWSSTAGTG
jgi:hypothetical protein